MTDQNEKTAVVICSAIDDYKPLDFRAERPRVFVEKQGDVETGSMVTQAMLSANSDAKKLEYFAPNSVALFLSQKHQATTRAKQIRKEGFAKVASLGNLNRAGKSEIASLWSNTKIICDYVEAVQIAIISAYTALEIFANISIPDDYEYKRKGPHIGVIELYDKCAIERRLGLKEKIDMVIPSIFGFKKPAALPCWSHFVKLDEYRNGIIHLKSTDTSDFHMKFFNTDIFDVCDSAERIMQSFYSESTEANSTNPHWPWLAGIKNVIPVHDFDPSKVEVLQRNKN